MNNSKCEEKAEKEENMINNENFIKIAIVGVGGAGNNVIDRMHDENVQAVDYISVHTDNGGHSRSKADNKIQIGLKVTGGLGAGANPDIGRRAAEENVKELTQLVSGYDIIFLTAGMGGGTGTGAAPVIAQITKELGILTVAVVTKPFDFEGRKKQQTAEQGIAELEKQVDSIVVIPNRNLLSAVPVMPALFEAFRMIDNILVGTVKNIVEVIQKPATINCDFADIKAVLKNSGYMHTAVGCVQGDNRAEEVVKQIKKNVLTGSTAEGAKGALLYITSDELNLHDVNLITASITDISDPDVNMILGVNIDESMDGKLKAVLISTRK